MSLEKFSVELSLYLYCNYMTVPIYEFHTSTHLFEFSKKLSVLLISAVQILHCCISLFVKTLVRTVHIHTHIYIYIYRYALISFNIANIVQTQLLTIQFATNI